MNGAFAVPFFFCKPYEILVGMSISLLVLFALFGVIFGSFINALVWRLRQQLDDDGGPRKLSKKRRQAVSIMRGRSMCPACGHVLSAKDLIPLVSWLQLKGKCRYCQAPISRQYPIIELLTGLIFALTYLAWPYELLGFARLPFVGFLAALVSLIALAVYDWHWRILPTRLIYVAGLLYGASLLAEAIALGQYARLLNALSGAAMYLALFFLIYYLSWFKNRADAQSSDWLGYGDVRLSFVLGLIAGSAAQVFLAMFIASTAGLLFLAPRLLGRKAGLKTQIPFGPFLIAGAWVAALGGVFITEAYANFINGLIL